MRPCRDCEQRKNDDLYDLHELDLIAVTDPERDPTHKPATDSEWWAWMTGAEPVPQRGNA